MTSSNMNVSFSSNEAQDIQDSGVQKTPDELKFERFVSIFTQLDDNGDGTIDENDDLSPNQQIVAKKIRDGFDFMCDFLGETYTFTLDGIKSIFEKVEGSDLGDPLAKFVILDTSLKCAKDNGMVAVNTQQNR